MADISGLVKALKDKAVAQYNKGAPYRDALASALRGDMGGVNQALSKSELTPMDVAMTFAPMGTFIGKNSKLWNPNQEQMFLQLEQKGLSPEEIWSKTGTLRGKEGALRQEIPDNQVKMLQRPILETLKKPQTMSSMLEHPQLYSAYDDMAKTNVVPSYDAQGWYSADKNSIGLSPLNESANWRMNMYKDLKKKTLLHEGMHKIQEKENFARGGSSNEFINDLIEKKADANQAIAELNSQMADTVKMMDAANVNKFADPVFDKRISALKNRYDDLMSQRNKMVKDAQIDPKEEAFKQYQRLAGEAESRLVERRMNLTPEQRLQYFPYSQGQYGLDVPYNELIVRGLLE